jgi:alginate O-acetyltransferase complex protein AlgI
LIDVYRGTIRAERSFLIFAAYIALFPQLIAGPIVRYSEVSKTFREPRPIEGQRLADGVTFFIVGFAKKVIIANNLGYEVDLIFAASDVDFGLAWIGAVAYSLQLYFDFSGYSDMAIGLGLMIGFAYPINFNRPYMAESVTDFWRRWHMTLSRFLRDYLYIPLGGNRISPLRTQINLVLTMLLGGLWHGAGWTFILWGGLHGVALALERLAERRGLRIGLDRRLKIGLTCLFLVIVWVPFRAASLEDAIAHWSAMAGFASSHALPIEAVHFGAAFWLALIGGGVIVWTCPPSHKIAAARNPLLYPALLTLFVVSLLELFSQEFNPFLYFQF